MNRLAYPGSPDRLNGAEDTSHIKRSSSKAENTYRLYIEHGSLPSKGASPATATGARGNGGSSGLSTKKQLLLLPVVIAVIVMLAIAYFAAKDALSGSKSEESAPPEQPAADAPADSGFAGDGATKETGESTTGDTLSDLTPADQVPEPIADFAKYCTDYDVQFNYYGADGSPAPMAKGFNCGVDTAKAPEVGFVLFTDDPSATAAVRDGKPILDTVEIPAESTRGSTFKAQKLESFTTVAEILPDNQGIVEYTIQSNDPEVAKKVLVNLGVAK